MNFEIHSHKTKFPLRTFLLVLFLIKKNTVTPDLTITGVVETVNCSTISLSDSDTEIRIHELYSFGDLNLIF